MRKPKKNDKEKVEEVSRQFLTQTRGQKQNHEGGGKGGKRKYRRGEQKVKTRGGVGGRRGMRKHRKTAACVSETTSLDSLRLRYDWELKRTTTTFCCDRESHRRKQLKATLAPPSSGWTR